MDGYNAILDTMTPISLQEMKAVRLMNRVDDKYLLSRASLAQLLERIAPSYFVQRIDGDALAPYHTLYFDTSDLAMYTAHHNRKLHRQKLRVRCYRSNMTTFFEIKNKNNKGKTSKIRIPIEASLFDHCLEVPEVQEFLVKESPYPISLLRDQLENSFRRITLVDKGMHERVTIDSEIRFANHSSALSYDLSPLVVMEVKREVGAPSTAIDLALRDMRIHPKRMSKYCIGTALTAPSAKINRFKDKLRYIDKIVGAEPVN